MPMTQERIARFNIALSGRLEGVPPEALFEVWPQVGPMLADAINRDTGSLGLREVFKRLTSRHMQLWVYLDGKIKACCVTQIDNRDSGKVCTLYYISGGYMNEWLKFEDTLGEWAKSHGCIALEGMGRPGWERVLKDWRKTAIVMRKDL